MSLFMHLPHYRERIPGPFRNGNGTSSQEQTGRSSSALEPSQTRSSSASRSSYSAQPATTRAATPTELRDRQIAQYRGVHAQLQQGKARNLCFAPIFFGCLPAGRRAGRLLPHDTPCDPRRVLLVAGDHTGRLGECFDCGQ